MSDFQSIEITNELKSKLKKWLETQNEVFPVKADDYSSLLTCYSIFREVGGANDELARFIFDEERGQIAEKNQLIAQVGIFDGKWAVSISSRISSHISIRVPQLREIIICRNEDLILSSEIIISKIKNEGLSPVIVKDWLKRTLFSDFDPKQMSYRDQLWVLRNNEVLLYSRLVSSGQIIFQELHDITAHIAGIKATGFQFAGTIAGEVYRKLDNYFGPAGKGNLPSHLLPFLIGIILDGLTQSTLYGSQLRATTIGQLLEAMDDLPINPHAKLRLNGFPKGIDAINGLFSKDSAFSSELLRVEISALLEECLELSSDVSATRRQIGA